MSIGLGATIALSSVACMEVEDDVAETSSQVAGSADVSIDAVGYGGSEDRGYEEIILPEYFVLVNNGGSVAHLGGWLLTDGVNYGGDGIARFPSNATIGAGETLVIANYPPVTSLQSMAGHRQVTFEFAYGYAPDYEIKGWQPDVKDVDTLKGRIRLTDGEYVQLIDAAGLTDDEAVSAVELETATVVSDYP